MEKSKKLKSKAEICAKKFGYIIIAKEEVPSFSKQMIKKMVTKSLKKAE